MKYVSISKVGMTLLAIISVTAISSCSSYTVPYRTYNLDASCHYYYIDGMGQKVYDGKYVDDSFIGLTLQQDSKGRWYYQDSLGNRIYKSHRC